MNDKDFQTAKNRIAPLFSKWIKDFGLRWYQIDIIYKMGDAPERGDGYIAAMNVVSRWQYRTATVTVFIEEVPENDYKLERMVVHELIHIFLNPMRGSDWDNEKEEYVVESLVNAFLFVEEGARKRILADKKCKNTSLKK